MMAENADVVDESEECRDDVQLVDEYDEVLVCLAARSRGTHLRWKEAIEVQENQMIGWADYYDVAVDCLYSVTSLAVTHVCPNENG